MQTDQLDKTDKTNNIFKMSFYFVGPQRTGTTWIYEVLRLHNELCLPKDVKETMFFDRYYSKGLNWYKQYFQHRKKDQLLGEIAPTYFDNEFVPKRISNLYSSVKIIITLRHPLERAISLYKHHLSKGRIPRSFSKSIEIIPNIIEAGHYAKHIPRWFKYFDHQNILIILTDDIRDYPRNVIHTICSFLRIDQDIKYIPKDKVNTAGMTKFPMLARFTSEIVTLLHSHRQHKIVAFGKKIGINKIYYSERTLSNILTDDERKKYLQLYKEDVDYVEQLLNRQLDIWRR
jgi:hypothetical protein